MPTSSTPTSNPTVPTNNPTLSPTYVPTTGVVITVTTNVDFVINDATDFDVTAVAEAMGIASEAETGGVSVNFKIEVEATINPVPPVADLQAAYAEMFGVDPSQVTITIVELGSRRLQASPRRAQEGGAQVTAEVVDSDASKINDVFELSKELTADTLASTLSSQDGAADYSVSEIAQPELRVEVEIKQKVADFAEAEEKQQSLAARVTYNTAAVVEAAGATSMG
jgi:hypothetical protein